MEELTQAEKAKLPASVDPEDAEFDARDEAEWVAFEEALHRWDARLLRVFPNRATSKRAHRPSGAEATPPPLGNYAKGRLDWFSARTKRDRFEELELVLLDDSRTNPVLAELFKVDETQKGTKSSTTAAGKPSGGPKRWSRGLRQCESRHWTQFAAELRRLLELMTKDPDRFVVVAAAHTNRFVQFASGEGNTRRGEAVGNHYLEVHEQLDRKTQAFLTRLGWKPPTTRQRNFSQAWPTSAGTRKPAAVAVRTLKEAFGIASPSSLEIKCETFS